jgi:HAD superfamily hydrolase (TIGR01509 family)
VKPEPVSGRVGAVLFDLDGTLVDSEPRSRAAWERLFATHGVPHDDALLVSFAGRQGRHVVAEHLHRFPGEPTIEDLYSEAISYARASGGPVEPVRGAVGLLRGLHAEGVPFGVVTSGTRAYATRELEALGVRGLLSVLVAAEDVSAGKPDPEGYLAGCAALGVEPARTVVFEDAPAGVAAAKAAGAYCVGLTTTQPASALAAADVVRPDLTGVPWPDLR